MLLKINGIFTDVVITSLNYQSSFFNNIKYGNMIGHSIRYCFFYSRGYGVYIGRNAGYSETGVYNDTMLGNDAGYYQNMGGAGQTYSYNTNLGYRAGYQNISGRHNTYVGNEAGFSKTGGSNVAVGADALFGGANEVNSGDANVAVGVTAGAYVQGNNTTHIGSYAGRFASGSNNVSVGYQAGRGGTTSAPTVQVQIILIGI